MPQPAASDPSRSWTEEAAWDETLALTSAAPVALQNTEDDLERELAFYNQVRCAVLLCCAVLCCAVLQVLVPAYCSRYMLGWVASSVATWSGSRPCPANQAGPSQGLQVATSPAQRTAQTVDRQPLPYRAARLLLDANTIQSC